MSSRPDDPMPLGGCCPTDTPYGGVTLDSFPSDQEMFALLRENGYTIQILGQDIPTQYLMPDYFQIRWASLKYQSSDGWHVDGVLVAKEAKLRGNASGKSGQKDGQV